MSRTFVRRMYTLETIKFKKSDLHITVTSDNILEQTQLDEFRPFQQWLWRMDHNLGEYELRKIHIQSVDIFSHNRIGFLKLKTEVVHPPTKKTIPGVVMLRGPTVAMLVVLEPEGCQSDDDRRIILLSQPRVPAGDMNLVELPAGMIDNGTFKGSAAKEIEEECGIVIKEDELTDMTPSWINKDSGILLSPGLIDESIRFYMCRKIVSESEMNEISSRAAMGTEHENISVKLAKVNDVQSHNVQDAKVFLALGLYRTNTQ